MDEISLNNLLDKGLMFEINRRVLHPLGLAISISADGVTTLHGTQDMEGVLYSPESFTAGQLKFAAYMLSEGNARLADRNDILHFTVQSHPDQGTPDDVQDIK